MKVECKQRLLLKTQYTSVSRERERERERRMEGMGKGSGGSSLEIHRYEEEEGMQGLYMAAFEGELEAVRGLLGKEEGCLSQACKLDWDVNPLRGLIEGQARPRVAALLLHHYGPDVLLLQVRCPDSGNTLLHHAALLKKDKLAIFLIKSLPSSDSMSFKRQHFLEAVNKTGQTLLHIATDNLLSTLVAELVKEKHLKVNIKDDNGDTVLDLIRRKCSRCTIMDDWKTPWRISISLRGASANLSRNLGKFEDEEDVMKKHSAVEMLLRNDEAWNITINIIVVIATLAFTLVFAAIFTIPQTLAPGGDTSSRSSNTKGGSNTMKGIDSNTKSLRDSLGHNLPFNVFVCSSTSACIFMVYVLVGILPTITSNYSSRAFVFLFAWILLGLMGISLIVAYIVAVYMYMGSSFTYVSLGFGAGILVLAITLVKYFDILKSFKRTCKTILHISLFHGLFVTLSLSCFPTSFVDRILFSIDT